MLTEAIKSDAAPTSKPRANHISHSAHHSAVSCGSVAKIGWGHKKPGPDSWLGGNLEEALYESTLSANVAFPDSFDLALPDHICDLIPADGSPRRVETEEADSGVDSAFDESVILLDDVIEILGLE